MANVRKIGAAVAVATTDVQLDLDVEHYEEGGFTVKNNGANALDAFEIRALMHQTGTEVPLATVAGDFSAPVFPLRSTRGAPVTLAAGATAVLFISLAGVKRLRFYASSAVGTTTLDIHGQIF